MGAKRTELNTRGIVSEDYQNLHVVNFDIAENMLKLMQLSQEEREGKAMVTIHGLIGRKL